MKNKEILSVAMAAALVLTPLASVGAEKTGEAEPVAPIEKEEARAEYFKTVGKVTHINKKDEGRLSLSIAEKETNEFADLVAFIDEDTLIFDSKTQKMIKADAIKKGDELEVFIKSNTPVTSSLPPQASPQVLVLKSDHSFVNVDFFNADLVNQENTLKLNLSKDSLLVDSKGEKLEETDIKNRDLLVFYGPATFSIPAQTNPIKVVALDREKEVEKDIIELDKVNINGQDIKLDHTIYDLEGNSMIPLRQVSEALGYDVKWDSKDRSAELTQGALWHRVKIGDKKYNFARMIVELDQAPVLNKATTYVPVDFLTEGLRVETSIVDGVLTINNK